MSIRNLLYLALTIVITSLTSCAEQDEGYEYDNWKEINEKYIDSIANVAQKNADGKWAIYASFSIGDSVETFKGQNKYFIYVHKNISTTEEEPPLYNDSIRVHYTGKILPTAKHPSGQIFDKSINGDILNEDTDEEGKRHTITASIDTPAEEGHQKPYPTDRRTGDTRDYASDKSYYGCDNG